MHICKDCTHLLRWVEVSADRRVAYEVSHAELSQRAHWRREIGANVASDICAAFSGSSIDPVSGYSQMRGCTEAKAVREIHPTQCPRYKEKQQ